MQLSISPARNNIQNTQNKQQNFKGLYFATPKVKRKAMQLYELNKLLEEKIIQDTIKKYNLLILDVNSGYNGILFRACTKIKQIGNRFKPDGFMGPLLKNKNNNTADSLSGFLDKEEQYSKIFFRTPRVKKDFFENILSSGFADDATIKSALKKGYNIIVNNAQKDSWNTDIRERGLCGLDEGIRFQLSTDVKLGFLGRIKPAGEHTPHFVYKRANSENDVSNQLDILVNATNRI